MSLLTFTKKIVGRQQTQKKSAPNAANEEAASTTSTAVEPVAVTAGVIGLTPLVTEKGVGLQGEANVVVFRVRPEATKGQIATAVADRYKVQPVAVRTMQMRPKSRRRGQTTGFTAAWKKAYVTLPADKTIDISV